MIEFEPISPKFLNYFYIGILGGFEFRSSQIEKLSYMNNWVQMLSIPTSFSDYSTNYSTFVLS